ATGLFIPRRGHNMLDNLIGAPPRILVRLTVSVSLSLMKPRAKIGDYVMVLQKITEKGGNIG
ncbi:hypothetical protein, partial [Shigella dysenteriae]|uniref:hypothetical protein n=2 Tax=Enterobacteriaceae TaxID=543 RepID=UPI000640232C